MLNLALIGLGAWGRRLVDSVHDKTDTVRFTVATARSPGKVQDFCGERGIRVTDANADALADPAVDAVVVAGYGGSHASDAMEAVEAGKPALVIKPLATTRREAEALYARAEQKGVLVALGYDRCFAPGVEALRARAKTGDLGRIYHAVGDFCVDRMLGFGDWHWKADPAINPPGSLADHMMYVMIELMGPVSEVSAATARHVVSGDWDDTATVTLRFASGATGSLTAIGVAPNFNRLHVFGDKGALEMRGSERTEYTPLDGTPVVEDPPAVDMCRVELETFAAAVAGDAPWPVTPADAINGVAALEAMGASAETGRPVAV